MVKMGWIIGLFLTMYIIATVLGCLSYLLIGPVAMWLSVFTVMPAISAALVYIYLEKMKFISEAVLRESMYLAAVWIGLSFGFDALTYIVIIPAVIHTSANWTFFRDQSPWIWLSYLILFVSSLAAHNVYARRFNA